MSQPKMILYVIDYFKNLNKKVKRNLLPKEIGFVANDIRYDSEYGSIEKRLSRAKYNSVSFTETIFKGMHRYYKNSNNSAALIFGLDNKIKIGYDDSGVASNLKTGISVEPLSFQTYKNLEYIFNGSDNNMVFTLSTKLTKFEDMGVPSTAAPTSTVSATSGNVKDTVYYAVSLQLDDYQEGDASPSSAGLNMGTGSSAVVTIPTGTNTRTTGRYIYRNQSGATTLYRLALVSDNSTTSYTDDKADADLDTTITAPIDYGIPASYKFVLLHKERILLARNKDNKSRIIISDIRSGTSYPDVFPSNNYLDIGKDDGDEITAIKQDHFGHVVVFKTNSVRLINTSADSLIAWGISDPLSNQGCVAPYSAATTPVGIIYLTRYGENRKRLVLWNGTTTVLIPQLEGIEPILTQIPDNSLEEIRGHYHNGYFYLTYRDTKGIGTYPNRVLAIDIYNDWATAIDKKNVACFSSWNGGADWGELYTGSSDSSGFIHREDSTSFDFLVRYKGEFDEGSKSDVGTAGTENSPSLMLTSGVADGIGAKTWASMTGTNDTWAKMTSFNSTWWLVGEWVSLVGDISAKALTTLFWNESKVTDTQVIHYIRTGENVSDTEAAAWNGPYSTASGADISGVSAKKFIQLRTQLFTKEYATVSSVFLYRQGTEDEDYAIKVAANQGTAVETTIEFDWESGRIDLGDVKEVYKRVRKRLRSVRVEYEAGSSTGNFDFEWYFNGSTTRQGFFNTSYSTYSLARTFNFPINSFCDDFIYRIHSNSDVDKLKIRKIIFTVSVEPYKILKRNL